MPHPISPVIVGFCLVTAPGNFYTANWKAEVGVFLLNLWWAREKTRGSAYSLLCLWGLARETDPHVKASSRDRVSLWERLRWGKTQGGSSLLPLWTHPRATGLLTPGSSHPLIAQSGSFPGGRSVLRHRLGAGQHLWTG